MLLRLPRRSSPATRPRTVDSAVAAGLCGVGLVEATAVLGVVRPGALLVVGLLPLPLVVRRRRPILAALSVSAGFVLQLPEPLRAFDRTVACYATLFLAAYSLGRYAGRPGLGAGAAGSAVAVGGVIGVTDSDAVSGLLAAALVVAATAMGHAVAARAGLRRVLEQQADELATAAETAEEAAATTVRAQLALRVQDVVHRHVGRMLDDARTTQRGLAEAPDRAAAAIAGIESTGREALDELRRLLALLRQDDEAAPLQPTADPGRPADERRPRRAAVPPPRRPRREQGRLAPSVMVLAGGEAAWSAAGSGDARPSVVAACLAGAAIAAPLVIRRSRPVAASVLSWAIACAVVTSLPLPVFALALTAPLLAYASGAHGGSWSPAGLAVGWAGVVAVNLSAGGATPGDHAVPLVLVSLAWLAGRAVAEQVTLAADVAARNEELERLRDVRAATASARERLRIARELHDVVAHTLMVMVVQAGAARRTLAADPARARAALLVVVETGEAALAELRTLLSLVSPDRPGWSSGMAGLPALVERTRATGLAVELRVDGSLHALPDGVDLAAYRIAQEALTNAIRHAGATAVSVHVRVDGRGLELTVRDDGRGTLAPAPGGSGIGGSGIAGMRERVGVYGGEFSAGPAPDGFVVTARFPLSSRPAEQHA